MRTLQTRLQAIAAANQAKYNCSIGIGLQSASTAMSAVAGQPSSSRFVWGSVTKQATGAAILQAVEENLISLDEPAYTHLDPMLASLGLGSLCELFGSDARLVTTRHLATMMSGIPDCARRLLNLHPAKLRCAGTLTIMVRRPCVADDTAKPFPPPPVYPSASGVHRVSRTRRLRSRPSRPPADGSTRALRREVDPEARVDNCGKQLWCGE